MTLTEGETRALLASVLLVVLAAVGRSLLDRGPGAVSTVGVYSAGDVDSALALAESLYAERVRRTVPLGVAERIDPNSADERELDRLPGIGPALARAIVEDRKRNGHFRSLADLERVPGLGSIKVGRLEAHVALPPGTAPDIRSPGGTGGGPKRLDLNRASAGELEALPGIGPARARAIVRWREEHGRFRSVEDLLEVSGIGPATLDRLRPLIAARP